MPYRRFLAAAPLCAALFAANAWSATFVVDDAGDAPDHSLADGVCYVQGNGCTLRAAIEQANALGSVPGGHRIEFNVPTAPGLPVLIAPNTTLPGIAVPVVIDGATQPGASANTLPVGHNAVVSVRLDGMNVSGPATGLQFTWGAAGSVLRGLAVTRFSWYGVQLSNAAGVTIAGNFIGTDGSGTGGDETGALANGFPGLEIANGAAGTVVGGAAPADRNLIVGIGAGVRLSHAAGTTVRGNYIGTDRAGTSRRGTQLGIDVARTDGATLIEDNVIGASQRGVQISNAVRNVALRANRIGVGADGAANIGGDQHGVHITNGGQTTDSPARITVEGNTIAHWTRYGIYAQRVGAAPALRYLRFTRNSLHGNGELGIQLAAVGPNEGVAPGSPAPATINSGQNPPAIQSAAGGAGGTAVQFSFAGEPGTDQTIEVFANTACHASGWGEGRTYLGQVVFTTDAGGSYTGSAVLPPVPAGTWLTMTASSDGRAGQYETSEFSQCAQVQDGGPAAAAVAVPTLGQAGLALLSLALAGAGAVRRRRNP